MIRLLFLSLILFTAIGCSAPFSRTVKVGPQEMVIKGFSPLPMGNRFHPGNPWKKKGFFVTLLPKRDGPFQILSIQEKIPSYMPHRPGSEILFFADDGTWMVQMAFSEAFHLLDHQKDIVATTYKCQPEGFERHVVYHRFPNGAYTPCDSFFRKPSSSGRNVVMDFEKIAQVIQELNMFERIREYHQAKVKAEQLKAKIKVEPQVIDRSGLLRGTPPLKVSPFVLLQWNQQNRVQPRVVVNLQPTNWDLDLEIKPNSYKLDVNDPAVSPLLQPKVLVHSANRVSFSRDLLFEDKVLGIRILHMANGMSGSSVRFRLTNRSTAFLKVEKLSMRLGKRVITKNVDFELAPMSGSASDEQLDFGNLLPKSKLSASTKLEIGVSAQYRLDGQQKSLNQSRTYPVGQLL